MKKKIAIIGAGFSSLAAASYLAKAGHSVTVFEKNAMIVAYPNPFAQQSRIEFKTEGGHTLVQLIDASGTVIKLLVDATYSFAGMNSVTLLGSDLKPGVYYIRIQNGIHQYVKTIVKM